MIYPNFEIVVVDNGSTDDSIRYLKEIFGDTIHIVQNGENLGYSKGFNAGITYAMDKNPDYLFILNNDTKVDPKALTELVKAAETDASIGFVSGKVYQYDNPKVLQTVGKLTNSITLVGSHIGANEEDIGQYNDIKEYTFIDDVFLLVRKEVIEKVGGYDSNFFLYLEETDWCVRVRKAGFKIIYTPGAKIWHKGSMSSGGGMNPINTYWLTRNKYLFMWRNATSQQWRNFMLRNNLINLPMSTINRIIKGQNKRFIALLKGNLSGIIWVLKNR